MLRKTTKIYNQGSRISGLCQTYALHNTKCVEREKNQQDAAIRCLLKTSVSTCFGHHYARLQENKDRVTAFGVLLCNKRENVDINRDVFFCGVVCSIINVVGTTCVYANVVCKWVCRGVGLVSAVHHMQ